LATNSKAGRILVMNCADWIPSAWFTVMNGRITRSYSRERRAS
jgi:hypothetical protein